MAVKMPGNACFFFRLYSEDIKHMSKIYRLVSQTLKYLNMLGYMYFILRVAFVHHPKYETYKTYFPLVHIPDVFFCNFDVFSDKEN